MTKRGGYCFVLRVQYSVATVISYTDIAFVSLSLSCLPVLLSLVLLVILGLVLLIFIHR